MEAVCRLRNYCETIVCNPHDMTLILSIATSGYVVQTSDRLTSKSLRGQISTHDNLANKTIVYRATDAIASISYSGLAYLNGIPTDSYFADLIWGSCISARSGGYGPGTGFATRPNSWTVDQCVGALKRAVDAIPQWKIRQAGGMFVALAGWRAAQPNSKPFYIEIYRYGDDSRAMIFGTKRHWPRIGKTLCFGSIGAAQSRAQLDEALAPYRPSRSLSMQDAEVAMTGLTRRAAKRYKTVGPHVLSVLMPDPDKGPIVCHFIPAEPHGAVFASRVQRREIEVAHTPWVIAPHMFQAPHMAIGHSIADLGGIEFHLIGAPPQDGLAGLAFSTRRPPP